MLVRDHDIYSLLYLDIAGSLESLDSIVLLEPFEGSLLLEFRRFSMITSYMYVPSLTKLKTTADDDCLRCYYGNQVAERMG